MQCGPVDGAACGIGIDGHEVDVKQSVVSTLFEIVLTQDYCCHVKVDESGGPLLGNERIPDLQFIDVASECSVPSSVSVDQADACDPLAGCDFAADVAEECQTEVSSGDPSKSPGCFDVADSCFPGEPPGPLKYQCKSTGCVRSFNQAQALSRHEKYECGRRCPKCDKWYAATINADTLRHRCDNVCPQCNKVFAAQDALQAHVDDECGKYLQCVKCYRRFKQLFNLQIHIKHECGNEHRCPNCNKAFQRPYALTTHMDRVIGTNAELQCLKCRTCFTSKCDRSMHTRHQCRKNLQCRRCRRRFKEFRLLTEHVKYCSLDIRGRECGNKFKAL